MAQDAKYGQLDIPGIGADEPVFVIRAKDVASAGAIEAYGEVAFACGASESFAVSVGNRADEFRAWQAENQDSVKVPD